MSDLTAAELEQRRQAARTHGLRSAFAAGKADESALAPEQRSRLVELREIVQTRKGAIELLQERAVRCIAVCEWAEEWLREQVEALGPAKAFSLGMMGRYFTAGAEARRSIVELLKVMPAYGGGPLGEKIAEIVDAHTGQNGNG